MLAVQLSVGFVAIALLSAPALAKKNTTLAEHARTLCEEAGVPLEDCQALHPSLRPQKVAVAKPAPKPTGPLGLGRATYGTGKYGWCNDCTSILAAAPVTPWENFGGRQRQPLRDEDDRSFADAGAAANGPSDDASTDDAGSDDGSNGGGDNGSDGGGAGGNGEGGDTGAGGGGEVCE